MPHTRRCCRRLLFCALCVVLSATARAAQLDFSGYRWNIREWSGAPGPNEWSTNCVWLDGDGALHLRIKEIGSTWYCGEVSTTQSFGYGEYRWYVMGRPQWFDSNVVAGLFTYFDDEHEVDIEFTYAFTDNQTNLHYTVQPWWEAGHQYMRAMSVTSDYTTHCFTWNPREIRWQSWYGHSPAPSPTNPIIEEWTYTGDGVPGDTNEHVHINQWLFEGVAPDLTATQNLELIIKEFRYTPSAAVLLFDEFNDGAMSNIWETFGDASGVCETNDVLRLHAPDADWNSAGYRTTNTLSWNDDGLRYAFSAWLSTVDVTVASTTMAVDAYAFHGILSGRAGSNYDPYWASNAATLKAGYDSSNDTLAVEFLTKTNQPLTWGETRFTGTITNFAVYGGTNGLELRFELVYSNYAVSALFGTNLVPFTGTFGSPTGTHNLGRALYAAHFNLAHQNSEVGRAYAYFERARVQAEAAEYVDPGSTEPPLPPNVVEIGDGSLTWRNPIDTKYKNSRCQVLYLADQVGRSGLITQLAVRVTTLPGAMDRYTIRLQNTPITVLTQQFVNTGWTTVYQADTTIIEAGWHTFTFTNGFDYNNAGNLLVDFSIYNNARVPPYGYCMYSTDQSVTQCFAVSADATSDPLTWTVAPGGKKSTYFGHRIVNVRLAFEGSVIPLGGPVNLGFEEGAGTNLPGWTVEGSAARGEIVGAPGHPTHGGTNALKLWDGSGDDQALYQFVVATGGMQYTFSGYLYSFSSDPFTSSAGYGALVIKWYGATGLLGSVESAHFTSATARDTWHLFSAVGMAPDNVTSARLECAIVTLGDVGTSGSILFDDLSLTAAAPAVPFGLRDEFNDTATSNLWSLLGNWDGAEYQEGGGRLRTKPGTEAWQTSGYITAAPLDRGATGAWHVFSAVLSTIAVESAQSGEMRAILALSSEKNNAWYVTNSCMLQGRYARDDDRLDLVFFTKSDYPATDGTERFSGTVAGVSAYLTGTGGLRMTLLLDASQYCLRFSDPAGQAVPVTVGSGAASGDHLLSDRLDACYWIVGSQNADTNRGSVYWDWTAAVTSTPPRTWSVSAAQTSADGSGLVMISNLFFDAEGEAGRLRVEASTNGGAAWFTPWLSDVATTLGAARDAARDDFQVLDITTQSGGIPATNLLCLTWDTQHPSNGVDLAGTAAAGMLVRLLPDDEALAGPATTSALFTLDNEAPSAAGAVIVVEGGAPYTFNTNLDVSWSGFADGMSALSGYYVAAADGGGTTDGQWAAASPAQLAGTVDAENTAFVWARDVYGNIGAAAADSILLLSADGDWDGDGYDNQAEYYWDTNPDGSNSFLSFGADPATLDDALVLSWNSSTGRWYTLHRTDEALSNGAPWAADADFTNVPGTGGELVYTDAVLNVEHRFYRISVGVRE
ncbi:MAG: glycoside hydrolase family 16 protein [Kiritimatiellae bacterium]|nr:glycoside hydrolase family 16 protein [Kiritimatiellia bacterium]